MCFFIFTILSLLIYILTINSFLVICLFFLSWAHLFLLNPMCCNSLFSFSLKFVGVPKVTHLSWILVFLTNLRHFISSRYSGYNLHFPSFCLIFRNPHLKDSGFTATEYSKHTYIHTHTYTSIITSRSVYMHKTLLFSHSVESDSL